MRQAIDLITEALVKRLGDGFSRDMLHGLLEKPRNPEYGDLTLKAFALKGEDQDLGTYARELAVAFDTSSPIFDRITVQGGFINFSINPAYYAQVTLEEITAQGRNYGRAPRSNRRTIVEYSSPNVGKELHVGHIRSTIVGESIARILDFAGDQVHRINYLGDTGLHLGKLMVALEEWGGEAAVQQCMEADPERAMHDLYVRFEHEHVTLVGEENAKNDSALTLRAKAFVQKLEDRDPQTRAIWSGIAQRSMTAFSRVYQALGVSFDVITGQSHFGARGKAVIMDAVGKGLARRGKDGEIIVDLESYRAGGKVKTFGADEGTKVLLRSDGTAIYATQDIGAAVSRSDQPGFDRMVYVVGDDQTLYFRQLFATLRKFGYSWVDNCIHISSGMIKLPQGKMSSRKGRVLFLEDVIDDAIERARKRYETARAEKSPGASGETADAAEVGSIAQKVGIGALIYTILSVDYHTSFTYDPERALSLEGNSGPFIQYAHVRAKNILRKGSYSPIVECKPRDLTTTAEELQLIKELDAFPDAVQTAAESLRPHHIATYANRLASTFNTFYQAVQITGETGDKTKKESRLALVHAFTTVMENAMYLLCVPTVEKM